MWIMLQDAFLSIVDPDARAKSDGISAATVDMPSPYLLVRARRRVDIERVFPLAWHKAIKATPNRDYQFRALIPRDAVIAAISQRLKFVDYGNFKGGSNDRALHDAYVRVWSAMNDGLSPRGQTFSDLFRGDDTEADNIDVDDVPPGSGRWPTQGEKRRRKRGAAKKKGADHGDRPTDGRQG